MSLKLVVVTATTNYSRAQKCIESWGAVQTIIVSNGHNHLGEMPSPLGQQTWLSTPDYLGTVPAFRRGVDFALEHTDADVICALHDDVEMQQQDWAARVIRHFERTPPCGLAGFGGAIGLASDQIYKTPYDPMQLARIGFRSNMPDAEVHGVRSLLAEQVACLDGFSQVGRREFFNGWHQPESTGDKSYRAAAEERPWTYLEEHGVVHHFYDGALGALAARYGWETWYLPIRCKHYGGQTAVADRGYQAWAEGQIPGGDHGFWEQSHRRGYELFTDVLPLRV